MPPDRSAAPLDPEDLEHLSAAVEHFVGALLAVAMAYAILEDYPQFKAWRLRLQRRIERARVRWRARRAEDRLASYRRQRSDELGEIDRILDPARSALSYRPDDEGYTVPPESEE